MADGSALPLPRLLPPGGTIGIVAPSSCPDGEALGRGIARLEQRGYRVLTARHVGERFGHLAGEDASRAADLTEMFERPDVDALWCARGGSGAIRLLPLLDWERLARCRKPFLGYSDITVLHLALLRHGLATFFAPMVATEFGKDASDACLDVALAMISRAEPPGLLSDVRTVDALPLVPGITEGVAVGGTLSLAAATLGTPFQPRTDGRILFFEDIGESPAQIERYLRQFALSGLLTHAAGFLFGATVWEGEADRYLRVEQVLRDVVAPLGMPAMMAWPFGHLPSPLTLPYGRQIRMDTERGTVEVLEPCVGAS